jgi:hypothetical protein
MQLDHEQLHRLLEALGESDIQEFRLEGDDFRLEIRRNLPGSDRHGSGHAGSCGCAAASCEAARLRFTTAGRNIDPK